MDRRDPAFGSSVFLIQQLPIPMLTRRISWFDEESLALRLVARHQHQNSSGLIDTRQVKQIAVLSKLIVDIAGVVLFLRAPQNQDGVVPKSFHEACAASLQIIGQLTGKSRQKKRKGHRRQTQKLKQSGPH